MASDYSRTCVSPDSIQTGEAAVVSETCEVYVWGSNSSHQLVEGTQEKILQPKLAASFADAQTVRERAKRTTTLLYSSKLFESTMLEVLEVLYLSISGLYSTSLDSISPY